MKILIVCGAGYISGKEKIMFSLLKGLAAKGHEMHCITSSWGNGQFEELLTTEQITFSKIRLGFISKTLNPAAVKMTLLQALCWPKLIIDYKNIIRAFKPDIVIHSNFHHLFLLFPAVSTHKTIHVYHSHESMHNTKFYRRLFLMFQKKIRLFVGVSEYVCNKLMALGINGHHVEAIQNGVEIIKYKPSASKSPGVFNIAIAGQVGKWKGHEDMLLAMEILKKTDKHLIFKLNIFGEGKPDFVEHLKQLIQSKQLEKYVEWKGFIKDINMIYADMQVICIPTRTEEPFATSALEAGLFAVTVIVTNKGGFPEMVTNNHSGFIVNARSPQEIADRLLLLINDPAKTQQMGLNHQQVISQQFSYKHFIDKWERKLAMLLSA